MSRAPLFAWGCLLVWSTWLFALQGLLAANPRLGSWTPDAGLLFCFALLLALPESRARWAAVWIALARTAFGADPPLAVLAGYLGFVGLCHAARTVFDLERPLVRGLVAGLGAAGLARFWSAARAQALAAEGVRVPALETFAWTGAATTAVAALLLLPALARLPGLQPLRRRRF